MVPYVSICFHVRKECCWVWCNHSPNGQFGRSCHLDRPVAWRRKSVHRQSPLQVMIVANEPGSMIPYTTTKQIKQRRPVSWFNFDDLSTSQFLQHLLDQQGEFSLLVTPDLAIHAYRHHIFADYCIQYTAYIYIYIYICV